MIPAIGWLGTGTAHATGSVACTYGGFDESGGVDIACTGIPADTLDVVAMTDDEDSGVPIWVECWLNLYDDGDPTLPASFSMTLADDGAIDPGLEDVGEIQCVVNSSTSAYGVTILPGGIGLQDTTWTNSPTYGDDGTTTTDTGGEETTTTTAAPTTADEAITAAAHDLKDTTTEVGAHALPYAGGVLALTGGWAFARRFLRG